MRCVVLVYLEGLSHILRHSSPPRRFLGVFCAEHHLIRCIFHYLKFITHLDLISLGIVAKYANKYERNGVYITLGLIDVTSATLFTICGYQMDRG